MPISYTSSSNTPDPIPPHIPTLLSVSHLLTYPTFQFIPHPFPVYVTTTFLSHVSPRPSSHSISQPISFLSHLYSHPNSHPYFHFIPIPSPSHHCSHPPSLIHHIFHPILLLISSLFTIYLLSLLRVSILFHLIPYPIPNPHSSSFSYAISSPIPSHLTSVIPSSFYPRFHVLFHFIATPILSPIPTLISSLPCPVLSVLVFTPIPFLLPFHLPARHQSHSSPVLNFISP